MVSPSNHQVIRAGGNDPVDSHMICLDLPADKTSGGDTIFTFSGFTETAPQRDIAASRGDQISQSWKKVENG